MPSQDFSNVVKNYIQLSHFISWMERDWQQFLTDCGLNVENVPEEKVLFVNFALDVWTLESGAVSLVDQLSIKDF